MTGDEFEDNLHYFTSGLDDPEFPCTAYLQCDDGRLHRNHHRSHRSHSIVGVSLLVLHIDHRFVVSTEHIKSQKGIEIKRVCSIKSIDALLNFPQQASSDVDLSIMLNHDTLSQWELLTTYLRDWNGTLVSFHYPYRRTQPCDIQWNNSKNVSGLSTGALTFESTSRDFLYATSLPLSSIRQTETDGVDLDHQKENALLSYQMFSSFKVDACRFAGWMVCVMDSSQNISTMGNTHHSNLQRAASL